MKSLTLVLLAIFIFTAAVFADSDHQDALKRLDEVIDQCNRTVRRLERFDIQELRPDVRAMKKSVRKLRAVKVLVEKLKSSERDFSKAARETKEKVRDIYKKLAAIPLASRSVLWEKTQNRWLHLQGQNPEFLDKSLLVAYQDRMQNLLQDFQNIEAETEQSHGKIIEECERMFQELAGNPWSNRLPAYKRIARIWEMTSQRRIEEGITSSSAFGEIHENFLNVSQTAAQQQHKSLERLTWLRSEIAKFFGAIENVSLAQSDAKWQEFVSQWVDKRDLELDTLSPVEAKQLEIELARLRSAIWSYKLGLEKELNKMHQQGQTLYEELLASPWAQAVPIYEQVMGEWKNSWQSKVDLSLENANAIDKILQSLLRIRASGRQTLEKIQAAIGQLRQLNSQLSARLGKIALAKRHENWLKAVTSWGELQYVSLQTMSPKQLEQYRQNLDEVSKIFLAIEVDATRELRKIFDELRTMHEQAADDKWLEQVAEWKKCQENWTTQWQWKTEVSFADSAELEKMRAEFQRISLQAQTIHKDAVAQALGLRERCEAVYQNLAIMGELDPIWPTLEKNWERIEAQKVEAISPKQMEEFVSSCVQLREEMDKLRPRLREACIKLFHKTSSLYEGLLEDTWTHSVEGWQEISSNWLARRPLATAVTIGDGQILREFNEQFVDVARKVRELKDPQFRKVTGKLEQLQDRYNGLKNLVFVQRDYRWVDISKAIDSMDRVNHHEFNVEQLDKHEQQLNAIAQKITAVEQDAQQQLLRIWRDARKLYELVQKNPWTARLAQKNGVLDKWVESWGERLTPELKEAAALRDIHRELELCWPFWWRPLPPTADIPQEFFHSIQEIDANGATVPVWSNNGRFLTFQTTNQEQMDVQILDLFTGQRQTVELYDRDKRWISFYNWAPDSETLSFCARQLGFYDLYYIRYKPGEKVHPITLTDTPEFEKSPVWAEDTLFFIQGRDIYYSDQLQETTPLLIGANYEFHELSHLQVRQQSGESVQIAFCANKEVDANKAIFLLDAQRVDGKLTTQQPQQISQLPQNHFGLRWNATGNKIVSYITKDKRETGVSAIPLASAQESEVTLPGSLRIPQGAEYNFRGPEIIGDDHLLCYVHGSDGEKKLCLVEIGQPQNPHFFDISRHAQLFHEARDVSLSPNKCFLSWSYLKEGEGRRVVVAVVDWPKK